MATLAYRADIDGLRAVAVLPVLFFHVGAPGMSGGYVGVDVFFVISGFLITSILHQEIGQGRFSIARFYERRIRRLWPALVVVIAATASLAFALLLPSLLRDFGQSLIAMTFFGSNILFFLEAGYFDGPAELKPLLHTWSLAVEEQFYLFFPPVLIVLHRLRARWAIAPVLVGSWLVSLGLSVAALKGYPSAVFYLLPFRAWELLFGAILAVGVVPPFRRRLSASLSGLVGLVMIVVPVVTYSPTTPFPGWAAVPPCLGTAMVIHAGLLEQGGWSARLLSAGPLVFVGKISYSLYLWHWPIVVFARYLGPDGHLDLGLGAGVVVASTVAAGLSWRFVERPFRTADGGFSARTMFLGALSVSLVWIALGGAFHATGGFPGRLSPTALEFASALEDFDPVPEACGTWRGSSGLGAGFCRIGDASAERPTYFLWGDSHAGILVHGANIAAQAAGRAGLYSNLAGCPPLVGVSKDESVSDAAVDGECALINARVLEVLEREPEIDTVILVGRWAYYANGRGVGQDAHKTVEIWPTEGARGAPSAEVFEAALTNTVKTLVELNKRVFVLAQVPEIEEFDAWRMANALVQGAEVDQIARMSEVSRASVRARQAAFFRVMDRFSGASEVRVLDPSGFFCDASFCRALRAGRVVYVDNNHVTTSASRDLAFAFAPAFEP